MSRRDAIRMSEDEVVAFLDEERTLTCATHRAATAGRT